MADMVSERYALSLYEVAQDEKQEKLYLDQLTEVCAAFDSEPDFLKMLTTPSIAAEDKQKVLKTVFEGRIEPFLLNFLMLVTDKGRIGLIHEMCQAYKEQYYFENGIVEVLAVTAVPMSAALTDKLRGKMDKAAQKMSEQKKASVPNHNVPKKLRIGDSVKVISMNLKGTVHSLPNARGDLYVQMGILRSLVNINDLILLEEDAAPGTKKFQKTSAGKIKMSKSASVSTEINLIGKTTDEAIPLLDKYLDDAYLAHLPSVRIVHGKGTGALRNAVQAHLKRLKYVKSFHLGEFGEGDAGVTIAEFKD